MKNILLACITIITAVFISIHEVKHIGHNDSSTCQICIVGDHLISSDISSKDILGEVSFLYQSILLKKQLFNFHFKKSTNHSTAPPLIS